MTRRTRDLLTVLAVALVFWASESAWSPVAGWFEHSIHFVLTSIYRARATAPCTDCNQSTRALDGIVVTYPTVLVAEDRSTDDEDHHSFSAFSDTKDCWIFFSSLRRSGSNYHSAGKRWPGLPPVIEKRQINGWEVEFMKPTTGQLGAAEIWGTHVVVGVDAMIDERLTDTDLSYWLERSFQSSVEEICRRNDPNVNPAAQKR